MQKLSVILFFILIHQNYSQAQLVYEKLYQDSGIHSGYDIKPTSDNGYIITGFSNPTETIGGQELVLIKIDSLGEVEWSSNYGDASGDFGYAVIETYDGGFLAVGTLNSFATSSDDVFMVKTDPDGNFLWEKVFEATTGELAADIVEVPSDSGFAVVGKTHEYQYLLRMDKYGDTLWTKTYLDTGILHSISLTSDGGFIMAGQHYGHIGGVLAMRGHLLKTDANGIEVWAQHFDGGGGEELYDAYELASGEFVAVGRSLEDTPPPKTNAILRKVDANGDFLWYQTYGEILYEENFLGICPTNENGFVMVGTAQKFTGTNQHIDLYLIKTDDLGTTIWEREFGDEYPNYEDGFAVCQSSDGGFVACGSKSNSSEIYLYVVKCNDNGSTVQVIELPQTNSFSVYPNPFTDVANVVLPASLEEDAIVEIYDLSGSKVQTLTVYSGTDQFQIFRDNLSSGTYIISVRIANHISTKKIIIN